MFTVGEDVPYREEAIRIVNHDGAYGYEIFGKWEREDAAREMVDDDRGQRYANYESAVIAAKAHVDSAYLGTLPPRQDILEGLQATQAKKSH